MDIPLLHTLLEEEQASALLANFVQLLPPPNRAWLVDAEGHLVGCYPTQAKTVSIQDRQAAFDQARLLERVTETPIGIAEPIWLREQIVGALIVAMPTKAEPLRVAALEFLGRVVSLLAENTLARDALLEEALEHYRKLSLFRRVTEIIAANPDVLRVARLILDECIDLVQVPKGAVMLPDPASGKLTVWAGHGLDVDKEIKYTFPVGHELAERVFLSGRTEMLERRGLGASARLSGKVLCVPLKIGGEVMGVISLAHTDPESSFRAHDIDLMNAFGSQAAIAIRSAQLFSDLSERCAQLEEANRHLLDLNGSRFVSIGDKIDEFNSVDFPRVVDYVIETLAPSARSRDLALSVQGDEEMPPVWADERRLVEAIYHFVRNAISCSRPGGQVRVRYWADDKIVRFEVQDTGMGISEEKLKLLRAQFAQPADLPTQDDQKIGLGLALVRNAVSVHGGRVTVASYPGVGSTFRFWLPVSGPGRFDAQVNRRQAFET